MIRENEIDALQDIKGELTNMEDKNSLNNDTSFIAQQSTQIFRIPSMQIN